MLQEFTEKNLRGRRWTGRRRHLSRKALRAKHFIT